MTEPIEEYLDELYRELHSDPRTARRLLSEVEAHLHERADELESHGMGRVAAEAAAVRAFGPAATVAAQHAVPLRTRALAALQGLVLLGGIGLIAIGASGVVAALMNAVFGTAFVGQLHETYSAGMCRHLLAVQPIAPGCARAAVLENSADAVWLRLLAGGAGVLALAAVWLWRRLAPQHTGRLSPAIGATVFGLATLALLGQSADMAIVRGSAGVGYFLSGGLVAAVVFACYAVPVVRRLVR